MTDNNKIVLNNQAKEYFPKKKVEQKIITQEDIDKLQEQINQYNVEVEEKVEVIVEKEEKKLNLNMEAKPFVPKQVPKQVQGYTIDGLDDDNEEDEEEDELDDGLPPNDDNLVDQSEIDKHLLEEGIKGDIEDEEESDDEKWFPKYKDCSCCTGYIYKCIGEVCKNLGVCYCKAKEEFDPEDDS